MKKLLSCWLILFAVYQVNGQNLTFEIPSPFMVKEEKQDKTIRVIEEITWAFQ